MGAATGSEAAVVRRLPRPRVRPRNGEVHGRVVRQIQGGPPRLVPRPIASRTSTALHMFEQDRARFRTELDEIRSAGLWKEERVITSPQGAWITVNGKQVLCLCANNYLGLANDPTLRAAAKAMVDSHGLGL